MKLHHIGYLTNNMQEEANRFCDLFDCRIATPKIRDEYQTAIVQFLSTNISAQPYIELVTPASEDSKLTSAIAKGIKLHHLCFQVENIGNALTKLRENGFFTICEPVDAVAFPNRKIAWCMDMNKNLIELVEELKNAPLNID